MPVLKEKLRTILCFSVYFKTRNSLNGKGVRLGFLVIELLIALCSIALFSVAVAFMQGLSSSLKRDSLYTFSAISHAEKTMEILYENPATSLPKVDDFTLEVEKQHPFTDIPYTMATVTVSWMNSKNTKKTIILYGGWYD